MTASGCSGEEDRDFRGDATVACAASSAAESLRLETPGLAMLWLTKVTREPTIGAIGGQSNGQRSAQTRNLRHEFSHPLHEEFGIVLKQDDVVRTAVSWNVQRTRSHEGESLSGICFLRLFAKMQRLTNI